MNELEKRIASLEACNRRWSRAAWVAGLVLLIVTAVAAKMPNDGVDVIRARRIEVLAPDGTPAIVLSSDDHHASLSITAPNKSDKHLVSLNAGEAGTQLMLMKGKESPLFSVLTDNDGSVLSLFDGNEIGKESRCIVMRSIQQNDRYVGGVYVMLGKAGGHKRSDIDAMLSVGPAEKELTLVLGDSAAGNVGMTRDPTAGALKFIEQVDQRRD